MKKLFLIPLTLVSGLILTQITSAKTNVEITTNGDGVKSNIDINNSYNSTSTNSNNSTNQETRVRITQNGETKEYTTTGDEDINVQSSDGNSKVQITNNGSSSTIIKNSTGSASDNDKKKEELKKQIKDKLTKLNEQTEKKEVNFSDFFKNPWNMFSSIFFFWRE